MVRQYVWLLSFGGIIGAIAVISFAVVCFCRTQFSKRLRPRVRKISKQQKSQTQNQNVAVITDFYCSTDPPRIILPETQGNQFDINGEGFITSRNMYATAKHEPITVQQQEINYEYNGYKNYVDLQVPNNDRYSYASYDSVGHMTNFDYINTDTENYTKDLEYIEVLPDDDAYDDVEII